MGFFANILGKFGSLILQVIVVVAAVLLFSFFDPFKMFEPAVPTLEDTPVSLRSIKGIGQLITAEYYGEVLVSLNGKYIEEIKVESEEFTEKATTLKDDFAYAAKILQEQDSVQFRGFNKKQKIKRYFHSAFPSLTSDPDYNAFLEALMEVMGERNEESLLKRIWKDKLEIPDIAKVQPEDFKKFKEKELQETFADNLSRKKQLVMLGRGWVKAGFDFEKFDQNNFRYDSRLQVIHFIGLQPQLLSCVINPWFIPEEGVKGFEIISSTSKSKPEQVLETKRAALEKLRNQALERDILNQAQINAAESLQKFFSLLLNADVKAVIFHASEFDYSYQVIAEDQKITGEELSIIDSLVRKNFGDQPDEVQLFLDSLAQYPVCVFEKCDTNLRQQRYGGTAFRIANDGDFTRQDSVLLANTFNQVDKINSLDSAWYQGEDLSKLNLRKLKCRDLRNLQEVVKARTTAELKAAQFPVLKPCLY